MEGYVIDFETPEGVKKPHWDYSDNILYKVEEKNGVSTDVTVTLALDRLGASVKSHSSTIGTITQNINLIQVDVASIDSRVNGLRNRVEVLESKPPITIDDETGNWVIDGEVSNYPSKGEPGTSFTYDDLTPEQITELAQYIASSVGAGTGGGGVAGSGTYNEAITFAQLEVTDDNDNVIQPNLHSSWAWLLIDVDDNNEEVKKVIYHVDDDEFIDALGAEIIGPVDGITMS